MTGFWDDDKDSAEAEVANRAANEVVMEMLRQKRESIERGEPIPVAERTVPSYEAARSQGNVLEMIKIKRGVYVQEALDKEREALFANTDISAVVKELAVLNEGIPQERKALEEWKQGETKILQQQYELDLKQLLRDGYSRDGVRGMRLQQSYLEARDGIDDCQKVKDWEEKILRMRQRRGLLEEARERYTEQNVAIINDLRRQRVKDEIERSGLLDS